MSQRHTLASLDEVDDGAVVPVVAHGEVNPVAIGGYGDDDLVPARVLHYGAVAAGGLAVEGVAVGGRELGEV